MNKYIFILTIFLVFSLPILAQSADLPTEVSDVHNIIKQKYAPDSRTAIFKPTYTVDGKNILLGGQTTSDEARTELLSALKAKGYNILTSLKVLPQESGLGETCWGIVKNSVCNLRSAADYGAENVTQAQMGMPVRIIQKDKWLQVQTCDNYLGWVENAAIERVSKTQLEDWNKADKVVVTALWGQVFTTTGKNAQSVSDVVAGNRLKLLAKKKKHYMVEYPDGRRGYISKAICQELSQWRKDLDNSAEAILETSRRMTGIPYLWAGFSPKGVDCSGFVRTVLYLHDIIIPRDASQMCHTGQRIEIGDFS